MRDFFKPYMGPSIFGRPGAGVKRFWKGAYRLIKRVQRFDYSVSCSVFIRPLNLCGVTNSNLFEQCKVVMNSPNATQITGGTQLMNLWITICTAEWEWHQISLHFGRVCPIMWHWSSWLFRHQYLFVANLMFELLIIFVDKITLNFGTKF